MMQASPFEIAKARGKTEQRCPVLFLEPFYTNHWDFPTLCDELASESCQQAQDCQYVQCETESEMAEI